MNKVFVFYATLLWGEYTEKTLPPYRDLPEGCYIHYTKPGFFQGFRHWFLRDLTPVLPEDVPKELKTLALLMGV